MQLRQLIAVLVTLTTILGVAFFVVTWQGDNNEATTDSTPATTTLATTAAALTPSSITTPTSTTTTTIPVNCTLEEPATETVTEEGDEEGGDEPLIVPTLGSNSSVTTVGLDEVTFGLTVAQAEQAAGTQLIPCSAVSDCYRVTPLLAPDGISFVVTAGTIERVDIARGPITTRSGVGIGSPEGLIIELFGDQIERQTTDDTSADLIFVPTDADDAQFRVIFTIRNGEVESFRSGRIPHVLAQDPCAAA